MKTHSSEPREASDKARGSGRERAVPERADTVLADPFAQKRHSGCALRLHGGLRG